MKAKAPYTLSRGFDKTPAVAYLCFVRAAYETTLGRTTLIARANPLTVPKPADLALLLEQYFFYAGAPDPILQFTTPEFGALLGNGHIRRQSSGTIRPWLGARREKLASRFASPSKRSRRIWQLSPLLAPSRFHHSARRIAVICVLSCAALTGRGSRRGPRRAQWLSLLVRRNE